MTTLSLPMNTMPVAGGSASPAGPAGVSAVGTVLRLESAAALAASLAAFHWLNGSWLLFALLFLLPDVAMLGYLAGRRIGAVAYNAAHTFLAPSLLLLAGLAADRPLALEIAAVWFAHIAFDRMLGYGLKHAEGFNSTHLGRIGR